MILDADEVFDRPPPSILYLTFTLPPEPGATKRPLRQAALLTKLGNNVTILTTMPNYPEGRIFPGYRGKIYVREMMDGVDVVRIWSMPSASRGRILRIISLLSFLVAAVLIGLVLRRRDIVMGSVTNPLVETAAFILSRLKRCALVYEIRDLVPDNLYMTVFRSEWLISFLDRYFSLLWRKADLVAPVNESMAVALQEKGVDPSKIVLLPHGIDFHRLAKIDREGVRATLGISDKFVVVYAGSFSAHYHVSDMVDAIAMLADRPNLRFLIIGTGPEAQRVAAKVETLPKGLVIMLGPKHPDEAELLTAVGDVFIESSSLPQSTKAIEYLVFGRPIISFRFGQQRSAAYNIAGVDSPVTIGDAQGLSRTIAYYMDNREAYVKACDAVRRLEPERYDRRTLVKRFHRALMNCP